MPSVSGLGRGDARETTRAIKLAADFGNPQPLCGIDRREPARYTLCRKRNRERHGRVQSLGHPRVGQRRHARGISEYRRCGESLTAGCIACPRLHKRLPSVFPRRQNKEGKYFEFRKRRRACRTASREKQHRGVEFGSQCAQSVSYRLVARTTYDSQQRWVCQTNECDYLRHCFDERELSHKPNA